MATIIVMTSVSFTEKESKDFIKLVADTAVEAFHLPPDMRDVYLNVIPESCQTSHGHGQITFFVYTAPGKPVEYKRALVQGMQETVNQFFQEKEVNSVVIIKEHPNENVGAGGILRYDARKGN